MDMVTPTNNKLKVTVSLEVTLVTCVTNIVAQSGQKLMILNNVCVGVLDEGDRVVENKQAPTTNDRQPNDRYTKPYNFVTRPVKPIINKTPDINDAMLIDLVNDHGPINCFRLGDLISIDRKNLALRTQVSNTLKRLASSGQIRDLSPSRIGLYVSKNAKITEEMKRKFPFLHRHNVSDTTQTESSV